MIIQNIALLKSVFILCAAASWTNFCASRTSLLIVVATSSTLSIVDTISPDSHHWPFFSGSSSLLHFSPRSRISSDLNCTRNEKESLHSSNVFRKTSQYAKRNSWSIDVFYKKSKIAQITRLEVTKTWKTFCSHFFIRAWWAGSSFDLFLLFLISHIVSSMNSIYR